MIRALLAGLGLSLSLVGAAVAAGGDGVFGNFLSRPATETAVTSREAGVRERERESRLLRRKYWERERGRLAAQLVNGTVVATR